MCELVAKGKTRCRCRSGRLTILFGNDMRQAAGQGQQTRFWSLELDPLVASITMNLVDPAGLGDIVKIMAVLAENSLSRLVSRGKLTCFDLSFPGHAENRYSGLEENGIPQSPPSRCLGCGG